MAAVRAAVAEIAASAATLKQAEFASRRRSALFRDDTPHYSFYLK